MRFEPDFIVDDMFFVLVNAFAVGLLAGGVGLVVVPTFAAICWMFWQLRRPLILAGIAGALVALGAMVAALLTELWFMFLISAPVGALGAFVAAQRFLRTDPGKLIATNEELRLRGGKQAN